MTPRIEEELELLRQHFGKVEHAEVNGVDWFKLPNYSLPPNWQIGENPVEKISIIFQVKASHPGTPPYGFITPANLNYQGQAPENTGGIPGKCPFEGDFMHFSWTPEEWNSSNDVHKGSNLLNWCWGFKARFKEGA